MATVKIGSARIDERGKVKGGAAGDQTGREVSTQAWYRHGSGWGDCLRAKDPAVREAIAAAMEAACKNSKIGYDQNQRTSLYSQVKSKGFDPAQATTACETDCSALVRVCICYATTKALGKLVDPGNFRTATEASYVMKTGLFERISDSDHTKASAKLARGDILCTPAGTSGHTVVVLSNGAKCDAGSGDGPCVRVLGGTVAVRRGAGVVYSAAGWVHRGDTLPYLGHDAGNGWHAVSFGGAEAWITGKSTLTEVIP